MSLYLSDGMSGRAGFYDEFLVTYMTNIRVSSLYQTTCMPSFRLGYSAVSEQLHSRKKCYLPVSEWCVGFNVPLDT